MHISITYACFRHVVFLFYHYYYFAVDYFAPHDGFHIKKKKSGLWHEGMVAAAAVVVAVSSKQR